MSDRAILARFLTQICPLVNMWVRGSFDLLQRKLGRMGKSVYRVLHHKSAKSLGHSFASLPPMGSNLEIWVIMQTAVAY
ncbi:MAG: hypothetical protein JRN52_15765, partial [Nitrososphaerota archaeon]|nr:hypothetical protein [Nitrososphaerota archaeon]